MRCSSCSFDNPEGARFCAGCGITLAQTCPACGCPVDAHHQYCAACGHRLAAAQGSAPATGERRQVTVLFCDLVGYTELSRQLDAEEVHGLLERFFARVDGIVESFGGTVDKHIGDCVMAVFGAPVAHGNDPERAARAALAIRDAMPHLSAQLGRPVAVHIGLASGQVVASGTGSEAHRAYTVTGASVNLASRLTDQAASGEILISDAVRRLLPGRFVCSRAGAALPWADFIIARARALAAWGRGERHAATAGRLRVLHAQAERAGLRSAAAALEATLGAPGLETLASA